MNQAEKMGDTRSEIKVKKFKRMKLVAIIVLVAFLLGGLILFRNDITIENLRYLIKYLDFSSSGTFNEETVIHYNADSGNRFHVFRGDLALVSESGVTLYDRRGSAVMTDSYSMNNPTAVCGDRYLAIYDLGGYQVRIYNSFSLLYENTFDYAVQGVSINGDGAFCVVTSEKSYHSAVFVYDRDFEEIHRWLSADKFAVDAYLSDQNVLNVTTVKTQNGELLGEMIGLKLGEEMPLYTVSFADQIPLALRAQRDFCVLVTDEAIMFLDEGETVATASILAGSLQQISLGEELFCIVQDELSIGVNFRLRAFDEKGQELISEKLSSQILKVETWEDTVYVLTHAKLYEFRPNEKMKSHSLDGEYSDLAYFRRIR